MVCKENIKNLANSTFVKYVENDPDKVIDILKTLDNYDYVNVETTFDLLDYINKKNKNICVINLSDNRYFCSSNYCLVKDKLYKYDKINLTTHYYDNLVSYSFMATNEDFFIKFCSSINMPSFYEETVREIEFLNKYADCGIDFIARQRVYDYYISDKYAISARKLIKGDFLSREMIAKIDNDKKLFILEEVIKQLVFLENKGIIYNDVGCANVMFDNANVTLVDLGSQQECSDKIKYLYDLGRLSAFSIYDSIIIFIYNLFNIFDDYIYEVIFSQKIMDKITNIYNYNQSVAGLATEILRLKYKNSCSFSEILDIIESFRKKKNKINHINMKKVAIQNTDNMSYLDTICNIKKQEIHSVIDICYFRSNNFKNNIQLKNKAIKYLQICQNSDIVAENRLYFNGDQNKIFMNLDIFREPLPNSDIVCCIGLFENLTNDQIWMVLENIKHSGSRYFAVNHYFNSDKNSKNSKKSVNKMNKYVNLAEPPFNFPPPNFLIPTTINYNYIAVYNLKDVEFFMKYHDNFMSNIRLNLYKYLKNNLEKLTNAFSKQDGGLELLKKVLLASSLDWDDFYYDKKYKDIVDNNDIFTEYVDLLLLIYKNDMERFKNDNKNECFFEMLNTDNYAQFSLITREFVRWYLDKVDL